MDVVELAQWVVMASSDSSDGEGKTWVALLFLLSGPAYFFTMYNRYRNASKRHNHEHDTIAQIDNMVTNDVMVRSVTGSSQSRMSDSNHRDVHG